MKFLFLIFNSRSGSTFLAKRISREYSNIIIVPESIFIRNLFLIKDEKFKEMKDKEIQMLINADYQFDALGIDRNRAFEIISKNKRKGPFSILKSLLNEIYKKNLDNYVIIVKTGCLINEAFTSSENFFLGYLYIYRDARGIVNSLISNNSPYFGGIKMGRGCIVFSAKRLNRFDETISNLEKRIDIFSLRYEAISTFLPEIMRKISEKGKIDLEIGSSDFQINPTELKIHSKIDKPFDVDRINAWSSEMTEKQKFIIEKIAFNYQTRRGYISTTDLSYLDKLSAYFYYYFIKYFYNSMRFYFFKLKYSMLSPSITLLRLKVKYWA